MRARSFLSSWFPVVAWAGLIFGFSSIPSLNSGLGIWDFFLRKIAHMVEFGVLALLLVRALALSKPSWSQFQWLSTAASIAVFYAMSDEFHQAFVPGRSPSAGDVAFDGLGVLIGLALVKPLARRWAAEWLKGFRS